MPSNRELKRFQSQNRDLRAEVERLTNLAGAQEIRLNYAATALTEASAEMGRAQAIETSIGAAKAEIAAERGTLAAARESLALVIAEAREDIADAETRLAALVERIEERGRRKERAQIGAVVNRAVLGCQRARREIEAAVERHLNRQGAARPGMEPVVIVADDPHAAPTPEALRALNDIKSMDLPLLALPTVEPIRGIPADQIILDERILDDGTSIGRYVEELPHETMAESAARADREGLDL